MALGLLLEECTLPAAGFPPGMWKRNKSGKCSVRSVCLKLFKKFCFLLCPGDASGIQEFFLDVAGQHIHGPMHLRAEEQNEKLVKEKNAVLMSLARVSMSSCQEASNYAKTFLIENTLPKEASEYLSSAKEQITSNVNDEQISTYVKGANAFGRYCSSTEDLKKKFDALLKQKSQSGARAFDTYRKAMTAIFEGGKFPDPEYTYRVSVEKYVNAIQFLSERLSCKLNYSRRLRVGSAILEEIPVLNREQYSLYSLCDQYSIPARKTSDLGGPRLVKSSS